jgi:hypothetical protein
MVSSTGSILFGSGFTVTKNGGLGSYTVNFGTAFASTPSVVSSIAGTLGNGLQVLSQTSSSFSVSTFLNGTAADAGFNFIAVGPLI